MYKQNRFYKLYSNKFEITNVIVQYSGLEEILFIYKGRGAGLGRCDFPLLSTDVVFYRSINSHFN